MNRKLLSLVSHRIATRVGRDHAALRRLAAQLRAAR